MLSGCNIVQPLRNHQYYVQIFVKLSHALSSGKKIQKKNMNTMAIRVVEFSNGVFKIRKIFENKSTYPKEIIEF